MGSQEVFWLTLLFLIIIVFLVWWSQAAQPKACSRRQQVASRRYIVTLRDHVHPHDFNHNHGDAHEIHHHIEHLFKGVVATIHPSNLNVVRHDPNVISVVPDGQVQAMGWVDHPGFGDVTDSDLMAVIPWNVHKVLNQTAPWDGAPFSGVDVYILDSGVADCIDLNVAEAISFVQNESPKDGNGHGTHVTGTIAASGTKYIRGVCAGLRIRSFKVLDDNGSGDYGTVMVALDEIVKRKRLNPSQAMVVNLSLGGYAGTEEYGPLDQAVATAIAEGIIVVIAAGNDGEDIRKYTPSHVKESISVGAFDQDQDFASFSNHGSEVTILAPGVNIPSTSYKGGIATMSGTSMATPAVVGVVARYLVDQPNLSPAQVKSLILKKAPSGIDEVPRHTTNQRALYVK